LDAPGAELEAKEEKLEMVGAESYIERLGEHELACGMGMLNVGSGKILRGRFKFFTGPELEWVF
jgi:hypothetical protein